MPVGGLKLYSHLHTNFANAGNPFGLSADEEAELDSFVAENQLDQGMNHSPWPENQLKEFREKLDVDLRKTDLPRSISRLGHALVEGSRSLEGWVTQKQMAVDVINEVKDTAHQCYEKLQSVEPLSDQCREIKLPMQWYCLRRGASVKALQFAKDVKRIRELASRASNEIHMHEGPARDLAQKADADLTKLKLKASQERAAAAEKAANEADDTSDDKAQLGAMKEADAMVHQGHAESEMRSEESRMRSEESHMRSVPSVAILASSLAPPWPTAKHSETWNRSRRHVGREWSMLSTFL